MNVEQRQAIERKIVGQVIDAAFANGYFVWIDNGGDDDEIIFCTTADDAKREIMQTDEEYLHLYKVEDGVQKGYGWVWCVYGNDGWDVIADYSAEGPISKLVDPIVNAIVDGSALAHEAATNNDIGQMITNHMNETGVDYETALVHLNID
jgi:hypothetical protein